MDGNNKIWLVTADMGYGHKRALFPLRNLAYEKTLVTEKFDNISIIEKIFWRSTRVLYETLSRWREIPIIGAHVYKVLHNIMSIPEQKNNVINSKPTVQVYLIKVLIKFGLCKEISSHIKQENKPLLTSFYAPAIAAEKHGIHDITLIVCDSDLSRAWLPKDVKQSIIKYCVPCENAFDRLLSYGVNERSIELTGFPLPIELIGEDKKTILKTNLAERITRLDPHNIFINANREMLENDIPIQGITKSRINQIIITYAVGGAGAQKKDGINLIKELEFYIHSGQIKINLIAGVRSGVRDYFCGELKILGMLDDVDIHYYTTDDEYFKGFNNLLHTTDILWTKPSELSFYSSLGLPIIIAPTLGPHEDSNKQMLEENDSGVSIVGVENRKKWLIENINNGRFAELAWNGYKHGRTDATTIITKKFYNSKITTQLERHYGN